AQGTPDNTVAVASGTVVVAGVSLAVTSGNLTMTAAHTVNPRFDLITVNNAGTKAYTAGTAAASPVFPAIPANSVVLAAIYTPANDNVINSGQIIDKRVIIPTPPTVDSTLVPKVADETVNNSATLQDDDHLQFTIGTSGVWAFMMTLYLSVANVTSAGFRVAIVGPASVSIQYHFDSDAGSPSSGDVGRRASVVLTEATTTTAVKNVVGTHIARIHGRVVSGGTGGLVKLQWAQSTAHASDNKVLRGSSLTWWAS
ncbi:MAG: hypothetical protein ACREQL_13580, partial [Candidatus Binatia bacterium]